MPHVARHLAAVALAPCAFALSPPGAQHSLEIQLTPAGRFRPSDGRAGVPAQGWLIDGDIARQVIERFRQRSNARVLDYEHQTLNSETNGQPAPAAGWIKELTWKDGAGLFATVELTDRARQFIQDGEYRYVSPVFQYNPKTGAVLDIEMAAITNHPALDGMHELELRAAATFGCSPPETEMNALLKAVLAALHLPEDTTEDKAIAALKAHDPLAEVRQSLALADDADRDAVVAACTALKAKGTESARAPDPEKYVAVATFEKVKGDLAKLSAQVADRDVDELVTRGLEEGRLLADQEEWARELGQANLAALKKYLDTTVPIAALTRTQTRGKPPEGEASDHLTDDERAVCRATGIDPKEFAAAKSGTEQETAQ